MVEFKHFARLLERLPIFGLAAVVFACALCPVCFGLVTLSQPNNNAWTISNGLITVVFDPSADGGEVTDVQLGAGPNLASHDLNYEYAGTPFGTSGVTQTYGQQVGPGNSYVDVWTSTASTQSSVNPLTYAFHYVVFANDPTVYTYDVLSHGAGDPATSVGQQQALFRSTGGSTLDNLYQINTSQTNLPYGAQITTNIVSTQSDWMAGNDAAAGRTVQNVTYDDGPGGNPGTPSGLTTSTSSYFGASLGDNGSEYFTKYDYSNYNAYMQAQTLYGPQYSVTQVIPSEESVGGGPTKQELAWTDPGILNMEFNSDHYGLDSIGYSGDPGDSTFNVAANQVETRAYGPFGFSIASTVNQTAAQINQAAINNIPNDTAEFQQDSELIASGYVPTAQRGDVQISASNSAGWSANTSNNWAVLGDNGVNQQESTEGNNYWVNLNSSGNGYISNVTPGTYRLSLYELGQWGTTVYNGVVVNGLAPDGYHNELTIPGLGGTAGAGLKFVPENFGTAPPIWTIGTPNRSDNEFTNGHDSSYLANSAGPDLREYYGGYNYWAEEAAMGNPGTVVYNATATTIGGNPVAATNDPNAWIGNQWYTFDPPEYDDGNDTTDYYTNANNLNGQPAYVASGGGAATYHGTSWTVNFTVTQAQLNQGQYVVLSVGAAALKQSLTVILNNGEAGHSVSEVWSNPNESGTDDAAIRSGDSAFYQWAAFQFPTSDLNAAGVNDTLSFELTGSGDGVMYDALRMEITNTSANPATTGWYDYDYITSSGQTNQNDALALTPDDLVLVPEPSGWLLLVAAGLASPSFRPRRRPVA